MSDPGVLEFFVPMIPRRKNRLRIVKAGAFHKLAPDEKGKEAQETLAARTYEHRPPAPFSGPVELAVTFLMPIPEGWPEWKRTAARERRFAHVSRPDRGNLLKLLEDALRGPFYNDDSQVCMGPVEKWYGSPPGYEIRLRSFAQATKESEEARPEARRKKILDVIRARAGDVKKSAKRLKVSVEELRDQISECTLEERGRCPAVFEGMRCGFEVGHEDEHSALTPTDYPWFGKEGE